MTARQVYEGVLVELNKVQAPSLLLEDFNYLFNKAINQYTNKRYNIYDINQQTTDDLRVLKSSVVLRANNEEGPVQSVTARDSLWGAIYEFTMPRDYLHILNCICNFKVNKPFKCYDAGTYVQFGATRLTADLWSQIINNFYMRPTYKRPYYYIHNVNQDVRAYGGSGSAGYNLGTGPTFDVNSSLPGQKSYAEGRYGRVPSERVYTPTDPGNIDIQQLRTSSKTDLYGNDYIADNNVYDDKLKYGIPRWAEFSELSGGSYVTGRGRLVKGDDVIASFNFDPTYNGITVWNTITLFNIYSEEGKYLNIYKSYKVESKDVSEWNIESTGNNTFTFEIPYKDSESWAASLEYVLENIATGVISSNATDLNGKKAYVKQVSSDYLIIMPIRSILLDPSKFINIINSGTLRYLPIFISDSDISAEINRGSYNINWDNLVKSQFEFELKNSETKKYNQVERVGEVRYGNASNVRLEIRYGKDNSLFTLDSVYIDYIKAPQWIRLTQEQLDLTEDTSQMMEFPDYVCQEIINELVHLVMENSADPRLQSHPVVTQSIAQPAQQLEQANQ